MRFRILVHVIAVVLCTSMLASTSLAAPTDPVTVESPPSDEGPPFIPGVRLVEDLPTEYVEEEFFVSGGADLYNYANNPPLSPADIEAIDDDVPYKTRMIVRRPAKANKFNGTVVIEWWNSTASFDTAPAWDPSAEYFANNGIVYVGVTNSTTSLGFLVGGCRLFGLPPACGTRYSTLSLPQNGLAYDILGQIANLLKNDGPGNPLPAGFDVDRVFHVGESQQGGSVITYASGFDQLADINDGYFVQSAIGARPINFGTACDEAGSLPYPDCTPRLTFPDNRVSTNLPVPVYQVVTQTDFESLGFNVFGRQPDTPTYRYYEVAGGAHNAVHKGIEIIPADVFGPDPVLLEDLCVEELNTTADGPVFVSYVFNALWERMQEQVEDGDVPPAGVLMDVLMDEENIVLQRDAQGNVLGGVRLPSMEAPTATYVSSATANPSLPLILEGFANLACRLSGAVSPFDDATLDSLYRNHGKYVSQVARSVRDLKAQGLLLQQDAVTVKRNAAQSEIGK